MVKNILNIITLFDGNNGAVNSILNTPVVLQCDMMDWKSINVKKKEIFFERKKYFENLFLNISAQRLEVFWASQHLGEENFLAAVVILFIERHPFPSSTPSPRLNVALMDL